MQRTRTLQDARENCGNLGRTREDGRTLSKLCLFEPGALDLRSIQIPDKPIENPYHNVMLWELVHELNIVAKGLTHCADESRSFGHSLEKANDVEMAHIGGSGGDHGKTSPDDWMHGFLRCQILRNLSRTCVHWK